MLNLMGVVLLLGIASNNNAEEVLINPLDSLLSPQTIWETETPFCSTINEKQIIEIANKKVSNSLNDDVLCLKRPCPNHSFCFLGACPCHPGYTGDKCQHKVDPRNANPWYTENCPNLLQNRTFDIDTPLDQIGGEFSAPKANKDNSTSTTGTNTNFAKSTAYLCYSHPSYGTAVVPKSLWRAAQTAEGDLWQQVGKYTTSIDAHDRAIEHWSAFGMFDSLTAAIQLSSKIAQQQTSSSTPAARMTSSTITNRKERNKYAKQKTLMANKAQSPLSLGRVIEVGAGPWTQLKGLLNVRPDLNVDEFTVWEPGAKRYMTEVPTCSYKDGKSLSKWHQTNAFATAADAVAVHSDDAATTTTRKENSGANVHPFPVKIISTGGELLSSHNQTVKHIEYDTLISINVLEHVQDAFQYLNGLYLSLRVGGILIFHDRYYDNKTILDGDLYHPIRIKRAVLDRFLSGFEILFNNCSAAYDNRVGEKGYYVIGVKLPVN